MSPSPILDATGGAQPGARLTADELVQVRKDLREVLDQHPEARSVMRYLMALEHALRKKGRHALEVLPAELLRRALGQLDLLVTDRSLRGLAMLRSKAAISIAEREREVVGAFERPAAASRPALLNEGEVVIEDVSHDTFLEANEEWERSFTGQRLATPSDLPAVAPPADLSPPQDQATMPMDLETLPIDLETVPLGLDELPTPHDDEAAPASSASSAVAGPAGHVPGKPKV